MVQQLACAQPTLCFADPKKHKKMAAVLQAISF